MVEAAEATERDSRESCRCREAYVDEALSRWDGVGDVKLDEEGGRLPASA